MPVASFIPTKLGFVSAAIITFISFGKDENLPVPVLQDCANTFAFFLISAIFSIFFNFASDLF